MKEEYTRAAADLTVMFLSERHNLHALNISRCWLAAAEPIPRQS